ncbi:ferritin-like fold-containing protein [Microlunatus soli]|uniref:tRNA-(MS[2]IO[6]A)-hydroxylase (MiaE)-like n=1 Tax=Microlunatus soli TaxID=630515 RepID=A0A1H1MTA4_9ACTN|nr:ferritin-like fold-containing protein [Microlunatus soli]SDR90091.1 tRNA-(MS[2]IO[6]A)-hydroxylase (MiaE)-like [Microlunatus soli]
MGEESSRTAGALELLGAVAYGELAAFDRLADDARLAPDLPDRVQMTGMAAAQFEHFSLVSNRIGALGGDVLAVMEPYHRPFDEFHGLTRPKTWHEGLVKAYIGDGLAADFYREVAEMVDVDTREVVHQVLAEEVYADFVVDRVRSAIEDDPDIGGRLALWGRRLVGEAMSQAQRVATERPALAALFAGPDAESPLVRISRMTAQLVQNHTARMARLGLSS